MATKNKETAEQTTAQSVKKNADGHGYRYADLAAVNEYIASLGETYRQELETAPNGFDYVITIRMKDGKDIYRCRGCKVPEAKLPQNKANPAQEYGSGLTYARRYSLYMAYGLAIEDDDAESFTIENNRGYKSSPYQQPAPVPQPQPAPQQNPRPYRTKLLELANMKQINLGDIQEQYGLVPNDTEDHYKAAYEQLQKDLKA